MFLSEEWLRAFNDLKTLVEATNNSDQVPLKSIKDFPLLEYPMLNQHILPFKDDQDEWPWQCGDCKGLNHYTYVKCPYCGKIRGV